MPIIEISAVSKAYPGRAGKRALLGRGGLFDRRPAEPFYALRDITASVEPGECLGIIGRNGSGKSTLLKLLAGVTLPSAGRVRVHGRVASLLELGAGFHPMLTGRENVYLNAGLLGLRHADVDRIFDQIVAFSGIAAFIDQPVDTYSSGMYVRIAFAVAAHANPDVFLVDEVLAVGDEEFQRKCRVKIGELREQGKTIVFVSHDLGLVHALCDRVVLLDGGRMIQRATPQAAIDFYLRQIGHEGGIHALRDDGTEAIFSHGRIALFQREREITAPSGISMQVLSLGQYHGSADADWTVTERADASCAAEAHLPRLPVRLKWSLRVEGACLLWRAVLECERPVDAETIGAQITLPPAYAAWHYGGRSGTFPPIAPGHLEWSTVVSGSPACREAAVEADAASALPPLRAAFESPSPHTAFHLANSDYMTGARVLHVLWRIPPGERPLATGSHDFAAITLDAGLPPESFAAWRAAQREARTVQAGVLCGRFENGQIEIFHRDTPISASVHLHTQMLLGGLWTMSQSLQWSPPQRNGESVHVSGESPRFPMRQHWTIAPDGAGLRLAVEIDAAEPLELREYNVSLGLDARYREWSAGDERGAFPEFDPAQAGWKHVNRGYAPAAALSACGDRVPPITLEIVESARPLHPTAINTDTAQHIRVLQAMAVPEREPCFTIAPGRRLLLAARISISGE